MTHPVRKRFGQHFLIDSTVIHRIIDAINPSPDDHILEIGPGPGAITMPLAESGCLLELVEIDRDLARQLKARLGTGVTIFTEDIMKMDLDLLHPSRPVRVVGNLPYNISTQLLFRLFSMGYMFRDLVFMLQEEVVDRIVAEPGSSSYGRLSVMSRNYCEPEKLFTVPPSAFSPSPRVNSAIVRLVLKEAPSIPYRDTGRLQNLLIEAFSKRRKTVRNALGGQLTTEDLNELGIDPGLRPENLSPDDYVRCVRFITNRKGQ